MPRIMLKICRVPVTICQYFVNRFLAPLLLRLSVDSVGKVRTIGITRVNKKAGAVITIGDSVTLCSSPSSNVFYLSRPVSLFAGNGAKIIIGEHAGLSGVSIVSFNRVEIGAHSIIGAEAVICDSDCHPLAPEERHCRRSDKIKSAPIKIGENCFIGARAMILKGVNVGDGAVVGAGSVVTRDVLPRTIVAGSPAQCVGIV